MAIKKTKNSCIGSTFESFLKEEGIFDEVHAKALKSTIAYQFKKAMKQKKVTQTELAEKMGTSRAVLQRLLNPNNISITLQTLDRAAQAIGKNLRIYLD